MALKCFIEYFLFRSLSVIVYLLPWEVNYILGWGLAQLLYYFLPYWRRVTWQNLRLIYGESLPSFQISRWAKEVYLNFSLAALHFLQHRKITEENLSEFVEFEGLENLNQALQKKRGVILLSAHFGNWELMVRALCLKGYPIYALHRPQNNSLVEKYITQIRISSGVKLISRKGLVREAFRCLKDNRILYTMMDQNVVKGGIFVPFLGKIAATATGTAVFALKTKAPVLPIFSFKKKGKKYRVVIGSEVPLFSTGQWEKDIFENTALFNRVIEEYIKKSPWEWLWLHPRWQTQPQRGKNNNGTKSF